MAGVYLIVGNDVVEQYRRKMEVFEMEKIITPK